MEQAKRPFDIDAVMEQVAVAVADYPPAVLFQLARDGYAGPFEQLVACIISIRTREETTLPTALRFYATARTPAEVAALDVAQVEALVAGCAFHEPKARQIHAIARRTMTEYGGQLPCSFEVLTGFNGVGPKCANLVLGIACGQPRIGVDIHVHRVTNRWGYVQARTPEATLAALEAVLPQRYWLDINRLLVPFGKYLCTGRRPHCSTCPLLAMCRQVGVQNPS
jgi:endonuclease III